MVGGGLSSTVAAAGSTVAHEVAGPI